MNKSPNPNDYGFTVQAAREEWGQRSAPPERMQRWRLEYTEGPEGREIVTWVKDGEPMDYSEFMAKKSERNGLPSAKSESPETPQVPLAQPEEVAHYTGAVAAVVVEVDLREFEAVR